MTPKAFILAPTYQVAKLIAQQRELQLQEWKFIHYREQAYGLRPQKEQVVLVSAAMNISQEQIEALDYLSNHGFRLETVRI